MAGIGFQCSLGTIVCNEFLCIIILEYDGRESCVVGASALAVIAGTVDHQTMVKC